MGSILIANANLESANRIAAVLKGGGIQVQATCNTGARVLDWANRNFRGAVVVCSTRLSDMMAVRLPQLVNGRFEFLFLVHAQQGDISEQLGCASLTLPLSRVALISSVNMLQRISDYSSLSLKKRIESCGMDEKTIINRAKSVLISRNNFTEQQAHRFIQKKSMDYSKKMVETAMIIVETSN